MTDIPFISGIAMAMLHVVTGPDHLAAVAPFALDSNNRAWKIGLFWGSGHLLGMLIIGGLLFLFREHIPVETISNESEKLVGLILILIGGWYLFQHTIGHTNRHIRTPWKDRVFKSLSTKKQGRQLNFHENIEKNTLASLLIGVVHGLAGATHFLLLTPVLGFQTNQQAITFIIGFSMGTILTMTLFSVFLGNFMQLFNNKQNPIFAKSIRIFGGILALIIGSYWLII